jgi:hypothetical protein
VIEFLTGMRRTLFAVGIAVLISIMAVPRGIGPLFQNGIALSGSRVSTHSLFETGYPVRWSEFILQTTFLAVLLAVIVNLLPRRK